MYTLPSNVVHGSKTNNATNYKAPLPTAYVLILYRYSEYLLFTTVIQANRQIIPYASVKLTPSRQNKNRGTANSCLLVGMVVTRREMGLQFIIRKSPTSCSFRERFDSNFFVNQIFYLVYWFGYRHTSSVKTRFSKVEVLFRNEISRIPNLYSLQMLYY